MKKTGIILLLLASVACGDELADLRAENAALRAENERLKKTLEKLTSAELEVTPEVSEETDDKKPEMNQVRYRGKSRSEAWVEKQYFQFADKIALVDGKYYDIGKSKLEFNLIEKQPPKIGEVVMVSTPKTKSAKIIEVLPGEVAVAERPEDYNVDGKLIQTQVKFRIHGLKNPKVGDVACPWYDMSQRWLIYIGSKNRVQEYQVYHKLTKQEFCDALNKGFSLLKWEKKDKPETEYTREHGTKKKMVVKKTIITKTIVK